MKKHVIAMGILALTTIGARADGPSATGGAAESFARLRTLAGEWNADLANGEKAHLSIELVAAGSTIVERADHVETTWQFYEHNKPTMAEKARYTRAR